MTQANVYATFSQQTKAVQSVNMRTHTPRFLHHLLIRLLAGDLGHIAAQSAVDGRVGDLTDIQEVWSQAAHT